MRPRRRLTMSARDGGILAHGLRRLTSAGAALAACLSLCLALTGCAQGAARVKSAPSTPTMRPTPTESLAVTSPWRLIFLGAAGQVEMLTPAGQAQPIGSPLPGMTASTTQQLQSAGVSSNGHTLAYCDPQLHIVDLTGAQPPQTFSGQVFRGGFCYWSPDGSEVADPPADIIFDVATHQATSLGAGWTQGQGALIGLGWLDNRHLAVETGSDLKPDAVGNGMYPTTVTLNSFDIVTHAMRPIASIHSASLSDPLFVLSPDGKEALVSNTHVRFLGQPYTPLLDLIDTTTGAVHSLDGALATTKGNFSGVYWRPGTQQVVVEQSYETGKSYLMDVAHDTATVMPFGPETRIIGWTPDGAYLALSSTAANANTHATTASALTVSASGQMGVSALSADSIGMPLGFVRMS